jgi:hypothetical protein
VIVRPALDQELGWIVERSRCVLPPLSRAIKAVDISGNIRGMVAYTNWTPNSCEAHMAADTPIAWRSLLGPAFSYPFEQVGVNIILGVIRGSNLKSLSLAAHFGFVESHRVADGWANGEDLVMIEMRKENCRWLNSHRRAA